MRIALIALTLGLLSGACSDKKFSAGTKTGTADAEPVTPIDPPVHKPSAVTPEPDVLPPAKEIEFGGDEVYRIGDGTSGAKSACVGELNSHDLKGQTYYFQFEVLEDDATVDVSIGKFCGVDQAGFTAVALQDESKKIIGSEIMVPTDATGSRAAPYAPVPSTKLKKGIYSVVIISKNTTGSPSKSADPNLDEYDDFVVGKIQVKSDKNVKQIKVFAE